MSTPQDSWQNPDPQWQQPPVQGPPPSQGQPPYGYGPGQQAPQQPYQPYPGMAYMPPPAPRPPMPSTARNAVTLMFVGMGITLLNIIVTLAQLGTLKDDIRERLAGTGDYTDATLNSAFGFVVGFVIVFGLIGAAFWLWMALICRAGRNWGRVVSTVFFGIGCLGLFSLANPDTPAIDKALTGVEVLVGLIAIILLWNAQSTPYFKPQAAYAFGQPPYGQPQFGQPGPGQPGQAPYGQQPPYGQG